MTALQPPSATFPARRLAALTITACVGLSLLAAPASAATPTNLYVDNTRTCSDSGNGSETQPFCTIAAATAIVTAGQTVHINGRYTERIVLARSGTPEQPIVISSAPSGRAFLTGSAGITVDGQHDIVLRHLEIQIDSGPTPVSISDSTRIRLEGVSISGTPSSAQAGIHFAGVTDSLVDYSRVSGSPASAVVLDEATTRVTMRWTIVYLSESAAVGFDIHGSDNTIVRSHILRASTAAIRINPGATGNVIADNTIDNGDGRGILNTDASGTAITNNTITLRCGTGIRVDGVSAGVSVQNNIAKNNGAGAWTCNPARTDEVSIGIYDSAIGNTTVDYNLVHSHVTGAPLYAWRTPMGLAQFRSASGQASHDLHTDSESAQVDSANSAAPGWQLTDRNGRLRVDDPSRADTGVGPIPYADRGALERTVQPTARASVLARPTRSGTWITVDASTSTAWRPLTITRYGFDFGDGRQSFSNSPIITHFYSGGGRYPVKVTVTDANGLTGTTTVGIWDYQHQPRRPGTSTQQLPPPPRRALALPRSVTFGRTIR